MFDLTQSMAADRVAAPNTIAAGATEDWRELEALLGGPAVSPGIGAPRRRRRSGRLTFPAPAPAARRPRRRTFQLAAAILLAGVGGCAAWQVARTPGCGDAACSRPADLTADAASPAAPPADAGLEAKVEAAPPPADPPIRLGARDAGLVGQGRSAAEPAPRSHRAHPARVRSVPLPPVPVRAIAHRAPPPARAVKPVAPRLAGMPRRAPALALRPRQERPFAVRSPMRPRAPRLFAGPPPLERVQIAPHRWILVYRN